MLVINKLAVHHVPAPAFVTLSQFVTTAAACSTLQRAGLIVIDPMEWAKIKFFVIYVMAFSAGTWSNMKVLQNTNVETVIVFRSTAPLLVCMFDDLVRGCVPTPILI